MRAVTLNWGAFRNAAPLIAAAGERLLELNEVAFLATVSASQRPRIHPFVPKIVEGRLLAFIMDSSPKLADLRNRGGFAMHTLPGSEDEEFSISGTALEPADAPTLREPAAVSMGFATGIDEHHILLELQIDRALWTRWLNFGTADHRPQRNGWNAARGLIFFD